ncbi:hypothetical protein [Caminibacter pacificus]|uniref:Uncharacterized protein n=1 Tax=Caminibacter pacificus TaxID=1424653 RepID=A0AAJ4REJ2_9BACT|nr:hypothetical protein [Caminibacter pacificus]NPA87131.1 hypothetical protein [Campylobacterota bacterium]QCI28130.1 hypothetical protein C6V80_03920 [Caminibacter pacificus]ROR41159.1 hypothetical protein EDC58_0643 [Caminibacter pacificus]
MKFLISSLAFITILIANDSSKIVIKNGKIDYFTNNQIKTLKCTYAINPFDTKKHYYCGIPLLDFVKNVCKKINIIKFTAYDDYETIFSKKEINDKTIFLAFESDNKKIIPKIVYTQKNYPQTTIYKKSIFLIKKAECK